jgi:hypothetical protein
VNRSINVIDAANIISRSSYAEDTYWDNADDENCTVQLWIPFLTVQLCDNAEEFEGVQVGILRKALRNHYRCEFSESGIIIEGDVNFVLAERAWLDKPMVISSRFYARKNRESRRTSYYIMLDSPYFSQRFGRRRRRFAGEILFFFRHHFRGNLYLLPFVQVMKRRTTAVHDAFIPVQGKSKCSPKNLLSSLSTMTITYKLV